jgi:AraC-like DNA-binding protein
MSAQRTALICRKQANPVIAKRLSTPRSALLSARPEVEQKDHLYLLPDGVIYTSPSVSSGSTTRGNGCILLTARRKPFEVSIDKRTLSHNAVAIRPLQERGLRAEDCELVSIMVHPTHREYRRFQAIAAGCHLLDRDAFASVDEQLWSAYCGELGIEGAHELLEKVIAITIRHLPQPRSNDPRSEQILAMLRENPGCQLSELSEKIGVSLDRMSHLFTRIVGLPWRSFQLWYKVSRVGSALGSGRRLAEIATAAGFADAAHLSNTWNQAFGAAPSKFFNQELVQVHYGLDVTAALQADIGPKLQQRVCPHCGVELRT